MKNITKSRTLRIILIASSIFMIGLLIGLSRQTEQKECTDYTLNQYEAGDVPVECINLFLEEYESN